MKERFMGRIRTEYKGKDIGCSYADELLGYKSKCLECKIEPCPKKDWSWAPESVRNPNVVFSTWLKEGNVGKVADRLGMSLGTARSYIRDYMFEGIHFYQECLAPDPIYQDMIKQYIVLGFEEGRPVKELAWVCNISYQHACRILKAAGKQLRRGRPRKHTSS